MRLSLLGSWLGATDNHLILGPGLVWSPQARLSRTYRTHAAWRQNLAPSPFSCTCISCGTGNRSFQHLRRRLHSHQDALEGGEPHAASLAPAKATTGFQARQLRARQISGPKPPENGFRRIFKSRHRESKPSKTSDSKNAKLDKALRANRRIRPRTEAERAKFKTDGYQDFVLDSSTLGEELQHHFDYWAPATVADAIHLEALHKARLAASTAERSARWAERRADYASVAKGSDDEEVAIRKADYARVKAESDALFAKQMATHAEEKRKAYETVRAELLAALETQPMYWDRDWKEQEFASGRRLRAMILSSCPICQGPHSLSGCKILFPDLGAGGTQSNSLWLEQRLFENKLRLDKTFREAMTYIKSKFNVVEMKTLEVLPLLPSATADAPASAIIEEYLQEFDNRVHFRQIIGELRKFRVEQVGLPIDLHSGYYITTDDDGLPLAIVYPNNAPSNIATDPNFEHEIQKFRTFTARWRRGEKSRYGQDPFPDISSISVIICTSVMSLGISNEELWNQGLFYRGIHIGTKDDEITNEYEWWSYGRREVKDSTWINVHASPEHKSMSEVSGLFARGLLRATLRSVKQNVRPILREDVTGQRNEHRYRLERYTADALRRAARKYGRESEQYRLLKAWTFSPKSKKAMEAGQAMLQRQWMPSWQTMMRLEEDEPEYEPQKPRPPPRTLRRQRSLHPRPPPTTIPVTAHQSWASSYRMKSIFSPDVTHEKEDVSSAIETRPERPPKARRPWAPKHRSPDSPYRQAVEGFMNRFRRAKSRRPETPPARPSKYRTRSILSHDTGPEEADVSSSGQGRTGRPLPHDKAARPQTPTHQRKGARSALGSTPGTKAVSSEAEGRGPRPVSQTRLKRRSNKYVPQNFIWW